MKKLLIICMIFSSLSLMPRPLRAQSSDALAIMKYLHSLPEKSDKRVISGQFECWGPEIKPLDSPDNYLNIVHRKTGKWVGLVGIEYHYGTKVIYDKANQLCTEFWKKGGFCQLYLIMSNPDKPESSNGGGTCDLKLVLDPTPLSQVLSQRA